MFTSSTGHGRRGFQPTLIHFGGIPDLGQCGVLGRARSKGVNFWGKLDFPFHQYQNRLLSKKAGNLGQAIL